MKLCEKRVDTATQKVIDRMKSVSPPLLEKYRGVLAKRKALCEDICMEIPSELLLKQKHIEPIWRKNNGPDPENR